MTVLHLAWLASIAGALLFFAAGAATIALRRRTAHGTDERVGLYAAEIARLRHTLSLTEATLASERRRAASSPPVTGHHRAASSPPAAPWEHHDERDDATTESGGMRGAGDDAVTTPAVTTMRGATPAQTIARELADFRARALGAEETVASLRRTEQQLRGELDHAREEVRSARGDLDRVRDELFAGSRELEAARARLGEVETQLAARTDALRDLSTDNERLKGRLRDADALRAEYVRLRTATTEGEYLKAEIARLQQELATTRSDALRAPRPRPARGTDRPATRPTGSIGESLSRVIDRFADAGTRSIAIGDPQGFVLASSGDDGLALAAHAAQLTEAASRATHLLPLDAPSSIEVVDARGARVSVWTFAVDGDRLLLASLAVSTPESSRVEAALAELSGLLAPTPLAKSGTTQP